MIKQEAHRPQCSPELTAAGRLLIIPYQPVKFQDNGLNSFLRYLADKVKMLNFWKGHT